MDLDTKISRVMKSSVGSFGFSSQLETCGEPHVIKSKHAVKETENSRALSATLKGDLSTSSELSKVHWEFVADIDIYWNENWELVGPLPKIYPGELSSFTFADEATMPAIPSRILSCFAKPNYSYKKNSAYCFLVSQCLVMFCCRSSSSLLV